MPIIVAAQRVGSEEFPPDNASFFEFNNFEFGAWSIGTDTKVPGLFTPLQYLGSSLDDGQPNGTCWEGFDRMSFVVATSSSFFNQVLLSLNGSESADILVDLMDHILNDVGKTQLAVTRMPNSFANYNAQPNPIAGDQYITLVDDGETNQNIPFEPLLVPQRNVDAILAFDVSADTVYNWPNGSSLVTTYAHTQQNGNLLRPMPSVPSVNGFVNAGLNQRPTFFGCNEPEGPIVVYVAQYPYSYYSNTSTYLFAYDNATSVQMMLNGLRSLTLNNTLPIWPTCLACALTDRANSYTSANRSETCTGCFNLFCWNGEDNTTQPAEYEPTLGVLPPFIAKLTEMENAGLDGYGWLGAE